MQTLDGVHVLLVEDHPDSRDLMKMFMEYQGALVVPGARRQDRGAGPRAPDGRGLKDSFALQAKIRRRA